MLFILLNLLCVQTLTFFPSDYGQENNGQDTKHGLYVASDSRGNATTTEN